MSENAYFDPDAAFDAKHEVDRLRIAVSNTLCKDRGATSDEYATFAAFEAAVRADQNERMASAMNDDRRLFHDIETRVLVGTEGAADDIQDLAVAWLRGIPRDGGA